MPADKLENMVEVKEWTRRKEQRRKNTGEVKTMLTTFLLAEKVCGLNVVLWIH